MQRPITAVTETRTMSFQEYVPNRPALGGLRSFCPSRDLALDILVCVTTKGALHSPSSLCSKVWENTSCNASPSNIPCNDKGGCSFCRMLKWLMTMRSPDMDENTAALQLSSFYYCWCEHGSELEGRGEDKWLLSNWEAGQPIGGPCLWSRRVPIPRDARCSLLGSQAGAAPSPPYHTPSKRRQQYGGWGRGVKSGRMLQYGNWSALQNTRLVMHRIM